MDNKGVSCYERNIFVKNGVKKRFNFCKTGLETLQGVLKWKIKL